MTNIENWTEKYTGVDEHRSGHYPVVLVEMNKEGRPGGKWLIGIYSEQETANQICAKVEEIIRVGEDGPPLTEQDVESIKQQLALKST